MYQYPRTESPMAWTTRVVMGSCAPWLSKIAPNLGTTKTMITVTATRMTESTIAGYVIARLSCCCVSICRSSSSARWAITATRLPDRSAARTVSMYTSPNVSRYFSSAAVIG
jgi:hypothetical protein